MRTVLRPGSTLQNGDDRLAAHTGDDHRIHLIRRDVPQSVAQTEVDPLHAISLRCAAGVRQRLRTDIRGDSAPDTPALEQIHRQIPVVGAHVRQPAALRHHVRQQLKPRL